METVRSMYEKACQQPSDINELLPVIKEYASRGSSAVELGVRTVVSTWALMDGLRLRLWGGHGKLTSYDLERHPNVVAAREIADRDGFPWDFHLGNSMGVLVPRTDLLFVDTLHTFRQLRVELALHSSKVEKYIVMHDTETFGHHDERSKKSLADQPHQGLKLAIKEFLQSDGGSLWGTEKILENNNGLTILKRL